MKQTAVEWLVEQLFKTNNNTNDVKKIDSKSIIEQAKEMEKQQQGYSEEDLEKAFKVGYTIAYDCDVRIDEKDEWFNRWFKIFKDNQNEKK